MLHLSGCFIRRQIISIIKYIIIINLTFVKLFNSPPYLAGPTFDREEWREAKWREGPKWGKENEKAKDPEYPKNRPSLKGIHGSNHLNVAVFLISSMNGSVECSKYRNNIQCCHAGAKRSSWKLMYSGYNQYLHLGHCHLGWMDGWMVTEVGTPVTFF